MKSDENMHPVDKREFIENGVSATTPLIKIDGFEHFTEQVAGAAKPVLVSCIRKSDNYRLQLEMLENSSSTFRKTCKFCFVGEEFLEAFCSSHAVNGTPTFLVFWGGVEKARKLGQVEQETMEAFISQTLSSLMESDGEALMKRNDETGSGWRKNHARAVPVPEVSQETKCQRVGK